MKKNRIVNVLFLLIIVLALIFSLCSCAKSEKALLSEFKMMTEIEPTSDGLEKAVAFINTNIVNVSEEAASRFVLAYEDFLLRFLAKDGIDVDQNSGMELYIYTEHEEGTTSKGVDYESIINKYGNQISAELIELLSIKASEAKEPAVKDATLQLSYEALLQRTLRTENLLSQHNQQDALNASALDYYKYDLFLLLAGSDNSPIFDYETGEFSPLAQEAYGNFIVENPETVLADILTEYFSYLNSTKYTMDYKSSTENKVFYDTCDYLINKATQSF